MKTAMQQLRENIELSVILSKPTKIIVCAFIDNLLEREKQQIIDARYDGFYAGTNGTDSEYHLSAEDYFNQKFTP